MIEPPAATVPPRSRDIVHVPDPAGGLTDPNRLLAGVSARLRLSVPNLGLVEREIELFDAE